VAVVVCAFYFWTAYTSGPGTGYYTLLTDAFLDGRTSLEVEPAPELLALPDPYDPAQNAPYRLHDATLYDGRYYLYFGPTPVVLVHMPLRLVGVEASDPLAAALLTSVGFLFALLLLRFLVDRYRPATSVVMQASIGLLLGLANAVPFMLRRPAVYEVAIAAGYCCLLAGLYLTLTGTLRARPSLARIAGGSLALGLAVGARPHLIVAIPVWIWAWRVVWKARVPGSRSARAVAAAAGAPLAGCLALLGLYNLVRFDSLTEFGSTYQLAGVNMQLYDRFALDRVAPGLFSYLLAPPRLDAVFPFAHLDAAHTGVLPDFYVAGIEPVAGLLPTTPFVALALAAPVVWLLRPRGASEAMRLAALLTLSAVAVMAVPIVSFDGATQRYEVDFTTLYLLAAVLVWLRLLDTLPAGWARGATVAAAALLALPTALFALSFSMTGYYDSLRTNHPGIYRALEDRFSFVPARVAGHRGHPIPLYVLGTGTATSTSTIAVASWDSGTADLTATFTPNPDPALVPGAPVSVLIDPSPAARPLRVTGSPQTVPVDLHRGINRIAVRWSAQGDVAVPAGFGIADVHVAAVAPDAATR